MAAKDYSHSHPEEPRTGIISRLKLQQGITATHSLERDKDMNDQQARIAARHHSHSLAGEPRARMISRLQLWQCIAATHILKCQGQA